MAEIQRLVERIVGADPAHEIPSMAMMLYGTPRPLDKVDAVAVHPGLGEDWRIRDGVRIWNEHHGIRHLLITGIYDGEETKVQPTIENLSQPPFGLQRHEGVHIQPHAHHTKEQADWLIAKIQELNIQSIAIVVSPFHLLRAFLTDLAAFKRHGQQMIPLIPVPAAVAPDRIIPETKVDGWTMIPGEMERIVEYQQHGDVATAQELADYLQWLWQQPIMADYK